MGEKQQMASVFGLMAGLLGLLILYDMNRSPLATQLYVLASVMILIMNFVYTVQEREPIVRKFPKPSGSRPKPPGWKPQSSNQKVKKG